MIARSSSTAFLLSRKPVMPDASSTDKIGIVTQRGQGQLGFFKRNKATTADDCCSNAIEKPDGTLHHAATQHNGVRRKQRDQIRQPQPKVVSLSFACLQRQRISVVREFADSFRGQVGAMRVVCRHLALDPTNHCRTGRERFPASVKTTYARWPRGLDHVMADLRV